MTDETNFELVFGQELHEKVIVQSVLNAKRTVWIATANLKDMHVQMAKRYEPILSAFEGMAQNSVRFRIIHSTIPSGPFRDTLDRNTTLSGGALEMQICPRSHWKMVIVDSSFAYFGSANFTGAGLGVKAPKRRNLELGAITRDPKLVGQIVDLFDRFWMGQFCLDCAFYAECPDPISTE